jgi:PmbA protein
MSRDRESFFNISNSLDSMAQYGLDVAQSLSLDAAKIMASCHFEKKLIVENKEFTTASTSDLQSLDVIIHHQQKKGSASNNLLDKSALAQTIKDAAALASYSVADPFLTFAVKDEASPADPLDFIYDETVHNIELKDMRQTMEAVLEVFHADKRIAIDRFEFATSASSHHLYNSNGVKQREQQTLISWQWLGMAKDGDQVTGMDWSSDFRFRNKAFESEIIQDAKSFCERLISQLNPRQCESYRGMVLLAPQAVSSLLVDQILYHGSGRSVMDGKSRWAESIGKQVVSDKFSLSDEPHTSTLIGATSFDQDGVPTQKKELIKDGILLDHLCDCYSAKKLGRKTTASAGGPFGLHVKSGKDSLASLLAARQDLLVVDRFSGNVDPITGDFSGVAKSSSLYQNGVRLAAVAETMIAGNFFELADRIVGISQEQVNVEGSYLSPWILLDGVSVTGQ